MKSLVSLVVVPRERFSSTRESLESIYANTDLRFELIYVDARSPPTFDGIYRWRRQNTDSNHCGPSGVSCKTKRATLASPRRMRAM